jgi:hypothetical protein
MVPTAMRSLVAVIVPPVSKRNLATPLKYRYSDPLELCAKFHKVDTELPMLKDVVVMV